MKKILLLSLVFVLNTVVFSYEVNILSIINGDTFLASKDGREIKVRMKGIDAPKLKEDYGKEAKKYLSRLILNKKVDIKESNVDKYGRVVGEIFLNNENINILMLKTGNARCMKSQKSEKNYMNAQKLAQKEKKGLWGGKNPKSPREFRTEKK